MTALLSVEGLGVDYRSAGRTLRALDGIDLELAPGEALGIVGESGSGKSTLARAILGLAPRTRGRVLWQGSDLAGLDRTALAGVRRHLTVVFQDPVASLDPRFTVADSIAEPLSVHEPGLGRAARARAVEAMLERVGLSTLLAPRYPHELSLGQCQRVAIGRAMISRPKLVVCDEPSSALDVSVQAQILNLFQEFQREEGTALLVISHNLALVRRLCARALVLYLGRAMEFGTREALFTAPLHPYTRLLLDSVPTLGVRPAMGEAGEPASPFDPPSGCVYRTRCRFAIERCRAERPPLGVPEPAHAVACWRAGEGVARAAFQDGVHIG